MAIAVDFDGVIHTYEKGWKDGSIYGDWMAGSIFGLWELMRHDAVFIFTSRSPAQVALWIERESEHAFEATTRMHPLVPGWWQWGKRFHFWNQRGVLLVTNRKLPATVYIDDRALRFTSWEQVLGEVIDDE